MSATQSSRASRRHLRPLAISFALVVGFLIIETVTGVVTGSLALLSDAGHMATDALGLGMALTAIVTGRTTSSSHTYGRYRLEIFAALANAGLLLVVACYVIWEAMQRIGEVSEVVPPTPMLIVAVVGLIVNVVSWRLLRAGARESINVHGAYLDVTADMAGSIGVIVAALVTLIFGWPYADPLFAGLIGVWIIPRALHLGRQSLRILAQAAPEGLDLDQIQIDLAGMHGVVDVHDLHVWTLASEMEVATVHLAIAEGTDSHGVLDEALTLLEDRFGVGHATLQVESETHRACGEASW